MPPKTFIRNPYPVEAQQWDGTEAGAEEILAWLRKDPIRSATYTPASPELAPCIRFELSNRAVFMLLSGDVLIREGWGYFQPWDSMSFRAHFTERESE